MNTTRAHTRKTLTSSTIDATAIEHAAGKILMKLQRSNIKNTH
jgi:hypothetical protein